MLKKPAANWREARRENARAAVLNAAWELVGEQGLAALSLRELARRAGITTPTVYAYFESKNAILDAMFAQAAQAFLDLKAALPVTDDPEQDLLADIRAFIAFCVADVPRYQLLFQHAVPGFRPSQESYGLAVRALDASRELLARNGVHDPRNVDIWTAVTTGLVDQQISNDPGGDRWTRLAEDVTRMFLAQTRSGKTQENKGEP
ncbi:TetR/AcrR family transcriptional regulator [Kribbella sp. CA-247076]|uniref:TetR/AcrR family transcriptional regulator n=1 Tax=Kribbella sp. CA-247076 TaxID=3239941 RepID=UPI003D8E30F6